MRGGQRSRGGLGILFKDWWSRGAAVGGSRFDRDVAADRGSHPSINELCAVPPNLFALSFGGPPPVPMTPAELLQRITVRPEQCGGRPCIRGMRIRVIDVLELLAAGESHAQILEDYPYLEAEDIAACLLYAARRLNHPNVAA